MEKPADISPKALNMIDDEDQSAFLCPGTLELMEDPVITADGNTIISINPEYIFILVFCLRDNI